MRAPYAASSPADRSSMASIATGSCSPIRTKRKALRRNWRISQTATSWSRVVAVVSSEACQPSQTPTVTAASTPEAPSSSAGR